MLFDVRVEYESAPIRNIAVQCPCCRKWFSGWDIVKTNGKGIFDSLRYEDDIKWAEFECPICKREFGGVQHGDKANIEKIEYRDDVYKDCLKKREVWE